MWEIVSEGTPLRTKIYHNNTPVEYVSKINIDIDAKKNLAEATITILIPRSNVKIQDKKVTLKKVKIEELISKL